MIVHVGAGALDPPAASAAAAADPAVAAPSPAGVSAETPAPDAASAPAAPVTPGDPADPARCHVEDGPAISVSTAQMLGCTAALSWILHDRDGGILRLGRRRRRPNAALRRAARERDKCRCRFPGCESRRVDLHHIVYWSHGGRTDLDNLVSLCKYHHMLVHERGYLIAAGPGGTFAFYRPDGTALPPSPPLPEPAGASGTATTPTSPRTRSSRRGMASGSTWTTPSTSAWPTPGPRRNARPSATRRQAPGPGSRTGLRTRRLGRPDAPVLRRTCDQYYRGRYRSAIPV